MSLVINAQVRFYFYRLHSSNNFQEKINLCFKHAVKEIDKHDINTEIVSDEDPRQCDICENPKLDI